MSCLLKWLSIHEHGSYRNACPMCRTPLFSKSISEVSLPQFTNANHEISLELYPPAYRIDVEYRRCLVARAQKAQWFRDECTADWHAYMRLFMMSVISFFCLHMDPTPLRSGIVVTIMVLSVLTLLFVWMIAKAGEQRGETK